VGAAAWSGRRKGEEPAAVFRFIDFWKREHGALPAHLVFDSRLTTYAGLARLDEMGVAFTLRRRLPRILNEIGALAPWRRITLDVPTRAYRTPRVWEKKVRLARISHRGGRKRLLLMA